MESSETHNIATIVVKKWLRKGKMARCLRDILPPLGLGHSEREAIASIVHDVVRWKKLYDYIMQREKIAKTPENYVKLAVHCSRQQLLQYRKLLISCGRLDLAYSASEFFIMSAQRYGLPLDHFNEEPETFLCVNLNKATIDSAISMAVKEGHKCRPYDENADIPAIVGSPSLRQSNLIRYALAHVQDISSQYVALIASVYGKNILDCCAGSGGKSLAICSITKNKVSLYAYDIDGKKLELMEKRAERYGANLHVLRSLSRHKKFDVVLVDAPCTGIGAARRNPEAKYVAGPGTFPQSQYEIVKYYSRFVGKNGTLVYCACSFCYDETDAVVQKACRELHYTQESPCLRPQKYVSTEYGLLITESDVMYVSVLARG